MKRFAVWVAVLSSLATLGQQGKEPPLSDTLKWMQQSLKTDNRYSSVVEHLPDARNTEVTSVELAYYIGCRVVFNKSHTETSYSDTPRKFESMVVSTAVYTVNLKDLDPQSIKLVPFRMFAYVEGDSDEAEIEFRTRDDESVIDEQWTLKTQKGNNTNKWDSEQNSAKGNRTNSGSFAIGDLEYAKRFVKAFRHAVELCGAKSSTF